MSGIDPETILDALDAIAADPPYPHWLDGDEADQGISYCRPCAEQAVSQGHGESVDGGWAQDNDTCCHCEECGCLLDYTLTDYGVRSEFEHFRRDRLRRKMNPDVAYYLARVIEHHREHPEVLRLLPKVSRALARHTKDTTHGE